MGKSQPFRFLKRLTNALKPHEGVKAAPFPSEPHEPHDERLTLLAMATHELKSPLQTIFAACDLQESNHGRTEYTAAMRWSATRIRAQLNDYLTLSVGQAGRLEIKTEPFEVVALFREVIAASKMAAVAKDLTIKFEALHEPLFVVADPDKIEQILGNLVGNAIKYTDTGGVCVRVWCNSSSSASTLSFEVRDSGIGISLEDQALVYEPYRRLAGPEREGAGLGLAVVKTLLDHLGGRITLQSAIGVGSTFTVSIPVQQPEGA